MDIVSFLRVSLTVVLHKWKADVKLVLGVHTLLPWWWLQMKRLAHSTARSHLCCQWFRESGSWIGNIHLSLLWCAGHLRQAGQRGDEGISSPPSYSIFPTLWMLSFPYGYYHLFHTNSWFGWFRPLHPDITFLPITPTPGLTDLSY